MSPAPFGRVLLRGARVSARASAGAYDAARRLSGPLGRVSASAGTLVAVAGAMLAALAVTLGAQLGSSALLLCLPAAAAAVVAQRRIATMQTGRAMLGHLDPLTGIGSSSHLRDRLRYEILRHTRRQRRLTVLVLDSPLLDQVHQDYGRVAGQEALRLFARQVERVVRAEDTLARTGRHEFSIVAPETSWQEAEALIERVRGALEALSARMARDVSFGYAVFPEHGTSAEVLLASAARAAAESVEPQPLRPALRSVA